MPRNLRKSSNVTRGTPLAAALKHRRANLEYKDTLISTPTMHGTIVVIRLSKPPHTLLNPFRMETSGCAHAGHVREPTYMRRFAPAEERDEGRPFRSCYRVLHA